MANTVTKAYARLCTVYSREANDDQLVEYRRLLSDIPEGILQEAVDELLSECKWMPTPAEIIKVANRLKAEASRGTTEPDHWRQNTYKCPACQDTGLRFVWHPSAMKASIQRVAGRMDERSWRGRLCTCTVRCTCAAGDRIAPRQSRHGEPTQLLQFDGSRMLEVDRNLRVSERIEQLLKWAREWKPAEPDLF